ncbi:hypothetical protein LVJ94_19225 [Pendulispora rubella]|uniref:Uncharacterized protein n=1 Tax=Pendulispora rubella TaxID=2741070 RepID=A0ABZ2LEZ8_9BACT
MTKSHSRRRAHGRAAAVLAGFALMAHPARAREPSRVIIVQERRERRENQKKDDAFLAEAYLRVASELRSIGFEVRERPPRKDDGPRAEVEADDDAIATILVRRTAAPGQSSTADIWIADHLTRKTVLRKIDPHDDPATLAMLVLELMRASLIEPFAAPSKIEPPPPEPVTRLVETFRPPPPPGEGRGGGADRNITLDAGASLLWGDLGLAVAPTLALSYRLTGPLKVGALAMAPAFGAVVRADQGVARVRQELALVELGYYPSFPRWIHPRAAIGLGVYHLAAEGDARAPYRDGNDGTWAFLTSASAGGAIPLSRTARIVLDARILVGFPRPVVRFASQEVSSALRPSVAFTSALEVDL